MNAHMYDVFGFAARDRGSTCPAGRAPGAVPETKPKIHILPRRACQGPPSPSKASILTTPLSVDQIQRGPGGNPPSSIRSTPSPSSIPTEMVLATSMAYIQNLTTSRIWGLTSSGCRPYTSLQWLIWVMICMTIPTPLF